MVTRILTCAAIAAFVGCGSVPTDSDSDPPGERIYTDDEWGFSIVAPADSTWGLNAFRFNQREANGLFVVFVRIFKHIAGSRSEPILTLRPHARLPDETLEAAVANFETIYQNQFPDYAAQERRAVRVASFDAVEWDFTTREVRTGPDHFLANRFLAVVWVRNDQVYAILSSGRQENFPEAEFRNIIGSVQFTN